MTTTTTTTTTREQLALARHRALRDHPVTPAERVQLPLFRSPRGREWAREVRIGCGVPGTELAAAASVDRSTVFAFERGAKTSHPAVVLLLRTYQGLAAVSGEPFDLFGGAEAATSSGAGAGLADPAAGDGDGDVRAIAEDGWISELSDLREWLEAASRNGHPLVRASDVLARVDRVFGGLVHV